jgi:AtzE family amidohydrolase
MMGSAVAIAAAVRAGTPSAREVAQAALDRIVAHDPAVHAFTAVLHGRAMADATRVDALIKAGQDPGPLAGVPFAVKNLFDVAGLTTLAGSRILADNPPAATDAFAVRRLCDAGAVLVGALNMEEFAYGFMTDNAHHGRTTNPHDSARTAGGSSGGSGAAVAAGLVPLALGSDTNGSIRVPSAFCGVYGFKPTYGRLSRSGIVPFVPSFDHVGPLAGTVGDIAAAYDAMQGHDPADPVACKRDPEFATSLLSRGLEGLRTAIAAGYFENGMTEPSARALAAAAAAIGVTRRVTIPAPDEARAAAYVITSVEGTSLQLANLRIRPQDFDPATRDRFLAGALLPAEWYVRAQRFRAWFREAMRAVFRDVDLILAPAVPFEAPRFTDHTLHVAGEEVPVRATIGRFTQPLSLLGLPILVVPVRLPGCLPVGIQVIGAPFNEAAVLRVGQALEAGGIDG